MTETEENQLLVDAETRRRAKASATADRPPTTPKDTLEASLERLSKLRIAPQPEVAAAEKERETTRLIGLAEIPPRHDKDIESDGSPWDQKRARLVELLGSGFMRALVGVQGTGKTQMGACLLRAAAARGVRGKFSTAMDFFMSLKATYDDGSKITEAGAVRAYVEPRLLVLDEMDERAQTDWENRLLFHMLNKRYNSMRDTLLISRCGKAEFLASVGASVQSRMQETGSVIECNWKSYREVA